MNYFIRKQSVCSRTFWLVLLSCTLFVHPDVFANEVVIEGSTTAVLTGKCGRNDAVRGKKDNKIYYDAIIQAETNAIQGYVASASRSVADAFEKKESEILAEVKSYIRDYALIVRCSKGKKTLEVSVKGKLNKSKFDRTLALEQMTAKERLELTSIFVARKQNKRKAYSQRQTDVSRSTEIVEADQTAEIRTDDSVSAVGSDMKMSKVEVGGNFENKSDTLEYFAFRPVDLDTAVNQIFTELGYFSYESSQIEDITDGLFSISKFEEEYAQNGKISDKTIADAFLALDGISDLLLVAQLDVGAPVRANGNERPIVIVDVNAKVYKAGKIVKGRLLFQTVAAYGPVQFKKRGLTETEAEKDAILAAATNAADQLGYTLQQFKIY